MDRPEFVGRRRVALVNHPFEAAVALAALSSSLVGVVDPASIRASVLGRVAGAGLVTAWQAFYALGGVLMLVGLLRSLRLEAAGLCLLIAGALLQMVSLIEVRAFTGVVSATTFGGIAGAAAVRIRVLWWISRQRDDHEGDNSR